MVETKTDVPTFGLGVRRSTFRTRLDDVECQIYDVICALLSKITSRIEDTEGVLFYPNDDTRPSVSSYLCSDA